MELPEATIQRLESLVSTQTNLINQLRATILQLENVNREQQNTIVELNKKIEKLEAKVNKETESSGQSDSSNSPPLIKK